MQNGSTEKTPRSKRNIVPLEEAKNTKHLEESATEQNIRSFSAIKASETDTDNKVLDDFSYLHGKELTTRIDSEYMKRQKGVNERMSGILFDWIESLNTALLLSSETFMETCTIADHYLAKHQARKEELQLIGVAALLIAGKYVESRSIGVENLVIATDHSVTKKEIISVPIFNHSRCCSQCAFYQLQTSTYPSLRLASYSHHALLLLAL